MKLTGSEDLRVQKTILAIRNAFQDLICEKDYAKITVKELCERAKVNKKTFYRYYPTLDDLLREVQEELSGEYMERTRGLRIPEDIEKITREFCEFSAAQGTYYERITCSQAYGDVRGPMMERVMGQREGAGVATPRGAEPALAAAAAMGATGDRGVAANKAATSDRGAAGDGNAARVSAAVADKGATSGVSTKVDGNADKATVAEDPERAMMMAFITEGTLAIYRTWVEQGKPVSPERLADLSVDLVCGGVRCYLRGRG